MRSIFASFLFVALCLQNWSLHGQKKTKPTIGIKATSPEERLNSAQLSEKMRSQSPLNLLPATNIGPTVMSGRVVDIAVDPSNSHHFFVAYATGGLWETKNNGASFSPIFDGQMVFGIGAIAVDWKNNKIWIGTGEANSSRSSYGGLGVFIGTLKGETYIWQHSGLADSQHIGRISIDHNDANKVVVAAMGHLYSPNMERGIFITENGGQTWSHTLAIDQFTGCIDIEINPSNTKEMFASAWTRKRRAWNFEESGAGSGIYHSNDGGITWHPMNTQGLPSKEHTGRIGLAFAMKAKTPFLYAFIDNQTPKESEPKSKQGLQKEAFLNMTMVQFIAIPDDTLMAFLESTALAENWNAQTIKSAITAGKFTPKALYDYLYEPTAAFYEKEITGAEVYKYEFSSTSWNRTHPEPLDDVVYSYGYYFGMIEVDPTNPESIYIAGVPLIHSSDAGRTWRGINPVNVHADHHALWINSKIQGHLINGCDGGIQISYDNGITWINCNSPSVAQCYAVSVSQTEDFQVYCGLQDNGVWVGPANYKYSPEWYQTGHYPYQQIMGGDGMQIAIDPRDSNRIITGYQFGQYAIVDALGNYQKGIHPMHELGETPLRWNWQTPILLSPHQPDILYICSNKVHRSTDGGTTFKTLSQDLTRSKMSGDVSFGTITCISESQLRMGHLVTGSDDGLVHVSKDNGYTWNNITGSLGQILNSEGVGLWVSRVIFSRHHADRIYISLNGYRDDYFSPHLYYTDDFGKSWISISGQLPQAEPVNVIKEDHKDPQILYIGTDHGLYGYHMDSKFILSLSGNLPGAPVHDLAIHETSSTLVVGSHGRGMYTLQLDLMYAALHQINAIQVGPITSISHAGRGNYWSKWFDNSMENLSIPVFLPKPEKSLNAFICLPDSSVIARSTHRDIAPGLQFLRSYDLILTPAEWESWRSIEWQEGSPKCPKEPAKDGKYYLTPGKYLVMITTGEVVTYTPFEITN